MQDVCVITVKVSAKELKVPDTLEVKLNDTDETAIEAKCEPEDASNISFDFASSDEEVATVDKDGKVKVLKAGECDITTTLMQDGEKVAEKTTHVKAFYAVHADVLPVLFQNELTQRVGRLGDAPSNARVVTDFQIAGLGGLLKFFVVVCAAPAAILYAVLKVPQVYTLVEGGRHHVFYGPCKRPSADVKLMAGCVSSLPCLGYGDVSVGSGRALYRDDRLLQLTVEILYIQRAENFLQVTSRPGSLNSLFHFRVLTFVFPIFARVIPPG